MSVCEKCGKKLTVFSNYEIDDTTLCYDCAAEVSQEKLRKGGNAFILDNKIPSYTHKNLTSEKSSKKEEKPSDTWAVLLKRIGKIAMIIIALTGMVIGGATGFYTEPFIGDDFPDMFLCGVIGLLAGGVVGVLSMAFVMYFSELGENTKKIASSRKTENINSNIQSDADELRKYKELLDSGALTLEEFNIKKSQILKLKESDNQN